MITQLLLFLILISGSVWGSAVCKKRFEDLLPLTCTGIVLVLFLCGILGMLKQGVFLVLGISVCLWGYAVYHMIKQRNWSPFKQQFLTPAFFVFTAAYLVLHYTNYGMMASAWDEFSHWADIVKAMVAIDDFGTNPLAQSMFQSYPPGMSLFQYFFQEIYLLLNRGALFSEWRLYFAYQIFFLAFLMPFMRRFSFQKLNGSNIFCMCTAAMFCCLGPMLVFDDIYIIVMIDAFLGLLTGTGMAMIFVRQEKDWTYDGYILCNLMMLVLAKDAGMLFAVFLLITYVLTNLCSRRLMKKKQILWGVLALASVMLPKWLWSYNIQVNGARKAFSNQFEPVVLWNVLTGADQTSYRTEVLHNFSKRLFTEPFEISVFRFKIPYIIAFLLLFALCYAIYRCYKKNNVPCTLGYRIVLVMLSLETIVYVCGLCVTYMFNFSEIEAVGLASFDRYLNIMLQGLLICLLMMVVHLLGNEIVKKRFVMRAAVILLVLLPWGMIVNVGRRITVSNTVNTRVRYMPIIEQIEQIAAEEEKNLKIQVIAQESAGYHRFILRYSLRPNQIVGAESIGKPFYEDDIYTEEMDAAQWKAQLTEEVDYVALYQLNDYFYEEFSEVFENPADIHENGVYRVDKETGRLILCESLIRYKG